MAKPSKNDNATGRILVETGKHEHRYFNATTEEQLYAAALKLLKERMHPRYGYIQKPDKPRSAGPAVTKEQASQLPDGKVKTMALRELDDYAREQLEYTDALAEYQEAERALRESDGKAAWEVIDGRRDHEYEEVRLVDLE